MQNMDGLLKMMLGKNASDLHIAANLAPQIRVDGELAPVGEERLTPDQAQELCYSVINEDQRKRFEEERELDFSFALGEEARFRGNLSFDRTNVAGAFRAIPMLIPNPEDIGVPSFVMQLTDKPRGLVLVTGPTGSGKSTTLATMIEQINKQQHRHVITVEDPIEFMYESKNCLINQREVGDDTTSFPQGLKHILRQDPDVVLIGEMRDLETISAAITISETGHLVFATLHTNTATETVNRIIDVFPPHQQPQIRTQLSFVLQAVLSQTLVPRIGGGRALAMEIMIPNHAIRNLIRENKVHQIYSSMITGQAASNMQTKNQAFANLVKKGAVAREEAMRHTLDRDELDKLLSPALRATPAR
jgi:twitching motility protein PilT